MIELLDYNLLLRKFVGMNLDDPVRDHSTFCKNRDGLIEVDIARRLKLAMVEQIIARDKRGLDNLPKSDELAGEIIESQEAGLSRFRAVAAALP